MIYKEKQTYIPASVDHFTLVRKMAEECVILFKNYAHNSRFCCKLLLVDFTDILQGMFNITIAPVMNMGI